MKRILKFSILITLTFFLHSCNNQKKKEIGKKEACMGNGNRGCIEKVRSNLTKTGKVIVEEEYLDNGIFGISFLDPNAGEVYYATVSTDCNCAITNAKVSPLE